MNTVKRLSKNNRAQVGQVPAGDELVTLLERHEELQAAAKEYEKLDKLLKDAFKQGAPVIFAGDFLVHVTHSSRTYYDVPAEIKVQYETQIPVISVKWERVS